MADGTVRHHINTLSNLYRRAQSEGQVPPGFNPVASILPGEKPAGRAAEAAPAPLSAPRLRDGNDDHKL